MDTAPAAAQFEHEAAFDPGRAREILRGVPELPGVFALWGHSAADQPYLTRGANLRRRMARLLDPPGAEPGPDGQAPVLSKRLNLRSRVARISWTVTGSEFESLVVLYRATAALFGLEEARRRLKLRTPYFVRLTTEAAHPRLYVTNRISRRSGVSGAAGAEMFGPFASRMAAERYCDAVLDLFKLRRCHELLVVSPEHPGCIYGEMKRCMAPCNTSCTGEEYSGEASAVRAFLETRGESLLLSVAAEREAASEAMDFERAAELHRQWEKVKATAKEPDELVTALSRLQVVVVQSAAAREETGGEAVSGAGEGAAASYAQDRGEDHTLDGASQASAGEPQKLDGASQNLDGTSDHTADGTSGSAREGVRGPRVISGTDPEQAAIFVFEHGRLAGPERLSTRGVRAVREQTAVGSSLFAQPLMLEAVPLGPVAGVARSAQGMGGGETAARGAGDATNGSGDVASERGDDDASEGGAAVPRDVGSDTQDAPRTGLSISLPPEQRLGAAMEALRLRAAEAAAGDTAELSDHLSLLRRWYYRPEKQRAGELFLPNPDGAWPTRRILNGAARAALGDPKPMPATDRDGARAAKTRLLHAGREGVERAVPVMSSVATAEGEEPATFRSRRKRGGP